MNQIVSTWSRLDRRKQLIIAGATVAIFAAILGLSRAAVAPQMRLLYSGLSEPVAGEIVKALEQQAVAFDVRDGSIYVDGKMRDQLRLLLASDGLPKSGEQGYEILDSLTGFGTTSQMFNAAYWRAKEGELARTITANPFVNAARVHIANTDARPFSTSERPSASVSITSASAPISLSHANAIRHLVAAAIARLSPENVTVVNSNGAIVTGPNDTSVASLNEDRANVLKDRVTRLLEARVGRGNAIVEVSVDTVTESESIREKRIDPSTRVAISTDIEERSDTSNDQGGGVTVASNLPDGDASNSQGSSTSKSTTRERTNFEVSETETEIVKLPGDIRRLTVAVLINGQPTQAEAGGTEISPRPEEELESMRDLVASAVGFNADRGDIITIKSMEFTSSGPLGTGAEPAAATASPLNLTSLITSGLLAAVVAILGVFVVRPILLNSSASATQTLALSGSTAMPAPGQLSSDEGTPALNGEIATPPEPTNLVPSIQSDTNPANPMENLRNLISARQTESVAILRGWLNEERGKAG